MPLYTLINFGRVNSLAVKKNTREDELEAYFDVKLVLLTRFKEVKGFFCLRSKNQDNCFQIKNFNFLLKISFDLKRYILPAEMISCSNPEVSRRANIVWRPSCWRIFTIEDSLLLLNSKTVANWSIESKDPPSLKLNASRVILRKIVTLNTLLCVYSSRAKYYYFNTNWITYVSLCPACIHIFS